MQSLEMVNMMMNILWQDTIYRKKSFKDSKYYDDIVMGLFSEEYLA